MQIRAFSKSVPMSPRKVRLVADVIRNKPATVALRTLGLLKKRAALPLIKTLKSAVANAVHNAKLTEEKLVVKTILINEGLVYKRFRPSTRGRVHPYKKRTSHITIILEDNK